MPFGRNNHGGRRANSGRRRTSDTLGPLDRQGGLHRFFGGVFGGRQAQNTTEDAEPTVANADAQNTNRREEAIEVPILPNYDAQDDMFDELLSRRGKSISDSDNLSFQRKAILEASFYNEAYKNISEFGILWTLPPSYIKRPQFSLRERWKDFFKLRVYTWIPEAMIGNNWSPLCPNCNKPLTKNGRGCAPRIVFDQTENYWLNAPTKYICVPCKDEAGDMNDTDDNDKYSFRSTSEAILKQIGASHPEVLELFPCYLTRKNAIDKHLMNLIIHSAVKGIGPSAMVETLTSWHQLQWQQKENQWAKHVIKCIEQPVIGQERLRREEIQKCPEYFSKELGGCIPSKKWLLHMFCIIIEKKRQYYDSECVKRARASKILAIDASYKVPKWMMRWGTDRIYDTLHSGTNEYNEIILQRFSTSDNHMELGSNLASLKNLGLDPHLSFSDDPTRDESLLKKYFHKLRSNDEDLEQQNIAPDNLTEFQTEKQIFYLYRFEDAMHHLSQFRQDIENGIQNTAGPRVKVAFDTEWPVFFRGDRHNVAETNGNINILTLGSNITNYTIVLELYNLITNQQLDAIGLKIKAIFAMKVACFTGCNHKADYTLLMKQYKSFKLEKSNELMKIMDDVGVMAVNRGITKRGRDKTTLQSLMKGQGMHLNKPNNVRVGTCFASQRGSLSKEAQKYCQLDVEAVLILHQLYADLPDLTMRMAKDTINVGDVVDVMPESPRSIEPIAQGIIKQIDGTWGTSNYKLQQKQVLVRIIKVFNGRGVIHYPADGQNMRKCKCGMKTHGVVTGDCNYYLFSQLGAPPFTILTLKSRLRRYNEKIKYNYCIYTMNEATQEPLLPTNYAQTDNSNEIQDDTDAVETNDDASENEAEDDEEANLTLLPAVEDLLIQDEEYTNDSNSDDEYSQEEQPTPEQERLATSVEFNETLAQIIRDADLLAQQENNEILTNQDFDYDLSVEELSSKTHKTVLADIFHLMDRAKLPIHHEYKSLFFRALRASVFIMNDDDVDDVKRILDGKVGTSWEKKLSFDFSYIAKRVRRRVPPPNILYHRMKAVFDFFKDRHCSTTNVVLFHEKNRNKFCNMLELVKKGYASDPPGMAMYVPKTDAYGRKMVDSDGLKLYRSVRGTSNLESLHQYLTTSFGHTVAGPMYSDELLTIVRHQYNWRMSLKNRPGFPCLTHYDGVLIDRINNLYEIIYGYAKYRDWVSFNENLPVESAYGIVSITKELTTNLTITDRDKTTLTKNNMLSYLGLRQDTVIPFLPIRGPKEKMLIHQKLNELTVREESMSNESVFYKLCIDWNTHCISVDDKIYPKLPYHLIRYIKTWRKNQNRKDAAVASGCDSLNKALEYVPRGQNDVGTLQPVDFSDQNSNLTETAIRPANNLTEPPRTENLILLCNVCGSDQNVTSYNINDQPAKVRKKRRCLVEVDGQKCPEPFTCRGRNNKENCVLKIKGDPTKLKKRKIRVKYTKSCKMCGEDKCAGVSKRERCKNIKVVGV